MTTAVAARVTSECIRPFAFIFIFIFRPSLFLISSTVLLLCSVGAEKFFIVQAKGANGDEHSSRNSSSCEATCYGYSCDHWNGNTCDELQSEYQCDCSGCDCEVETCVDTDSNGTATDPYGDGCDAYVVYPGWCGRYDDSDFTSNAMCCGCGGGSTQNISIDVVTLPAYGSAADDADGKPMRGTPYPSSLKRFQYCVAPGDYTIVAIDNAGDGWWGNAYYSVVVGGTTVIYEEMGRISSSIQSTPFTANLPLSARTTFSENRAPQGGGGALFWEDSPPGNLNNYRNESESNTALYGAYVATPARTLLARNHSFKTTSGDSMATDPVTIELKDRCVTTHASICWWP